jgi:hypothetical protein
MIEEYYHKRNKYILSSLSFPLLLIEHIFLRIVVTKIPFGYGTDMHSRNAVNSTRITIAVFPNLGPRVPPTVNIFVVVLDKPTSFSSLRA